MTTTTWTVLKFRTQSGSWGEVGELETEAAYYLGHDVSEKIGEEYGAGKYLFLNEEGQRFTRLTIDSRRVFFEVAQDVPAPAMPAETPV